MESLSNEDASSGRLSKNVDEPRQSRQDLQSGPVASEADAVVSNPADGQGESVPELPESAALKEKTDIAPAPDPALVLEKLKAALKTTETDLQACQELPARLVSIKHKRAQEQGVVQRQESPAPPEIMQTCRRSAPCPSRWEEMSGTNQFRLCNLCSLYVYDLKDMDFEQAKQLVFKREAKPVACLYRRCDGRFLTQNCPVGVRRAKRRLALTAGALLFAISLAALGIFLHLRQDEAFNVAAESHAKIDARPAENKLSPAPGGASFLPETRQAKEEAGDGSVITSGYFLPPGANSLDLKPIPDIAAPPAVVQSAEERR